MSYGEDARFVTALYRIVADNYKAVNGRKISGIPDDVVLAAFEYVEWARKFMERAKMAMKRGEYSWASKLLLNAYFHTAVADNMLLSGSMDPGKWENAL
jgi:alkyl sulfatase BDS1-like metallo-beta-lactamase superfamily hydrolase